jgi:NAD(P)-dependent dehydrogenase (short-subunit alcohol dehydrogenase family)
MKIVVTGHTTGIGKALADVYRQHGHEVVGFSRSTGHDIRQEANRQAIIEASADADVFINNARGSPDDDFAQVKLLFEIWQVWQSQQRQIINISSSLTMRWEHDVGILTYRTSKRALEDACDFLWNKSSWPAVSVIAPCRTDTPSTEYLKTSNKVDAMEFAQLVYHTSTQTNFRVQVLKLALNPLRD